MAHSALRLRVGALTAAAGLTLAGLVAASPAMAEEVPAAPQIELSQTTFPAGDWQGGFTLTGSGFDPSVPTAEFGIGGSGANGGGIVFDETVDVAEDGTIDVLIVPDEPTQAPDADGYPIYSAAVSQLVDGQYINSNTIVITITEGVSLTAAAEATVEQVTAGVAAQYAGFGSAEPIEWGAALWRWSEADGQQLISEAYGEGPADANGAGSFAAVLANSQVGDSIQIRVIGESGRIAEAWVQVVVTPAPAPAPAPEQPAAPAAAPRLPDTGVDLGIGFAALALLVLGAGAVVVTRRARASQQH